MRKWWNWQTHHLEGVAAQAMRVQVPPSAPFSCQGLALSAGLDGALGSVASLSSLGSGFDGGTDMTSHTSNARRISSINTVRSRSALMTSTAE